MRHIVLLREVSLELRILIVSCLTAHTDVVYRSRGGWPARHTGNNAQLVDFAWVEQALRYLSDVYWHGKCSSPEVSYLLRDQQTRPSVTIMVQDV
jgi:hypothetical protein